MSAIVDSSLIYQFILCLRTARLAFKQKCPWTWCVRMCMFCFRRPPYIFCFKRLPCMFCFGRSPFIFALGGHPLFFSKRSPFILFQDVTLPMFCFWMSPYVLFLAITPWMYSFRWCYVLRRSPCMFCFTAAIIHFPAMASVSSISLLINNYATELSRGIITVLGRHGKQFRKMSIWWLHYLKIIKIFTPWLHIFCVQRCL